MSGGSAQIAEGYPRVLVVEAEEHYFLAECTLELLGPVANLDFLLGMGLTPGNRATKDWRVMFRSRADGHGVTMSPHRTIFLRALRRARKVRLVYVQTGPDFGSLAKVLTFWILCRLRGERTVVALHEVTAYLKSGRSLADRLRARALRHVRGIVFESDALRDLFVAEGAVGPAGPRLGVVRVRYARPPETWAPPPPVGDRPDGRLHVGLVGGVTRKRRDFGVLAEALRLLTPDERASIRLVTLGNCTKQRCFDIMEPLTRLVDVDLVNRHLTEEEFRTRGAGCHVLLAPLIAEFAYGRRKGTGAYADAVALARPIIVPTDSDPLGEYAALTLPYDDAEGLAGRLRGALESPPRLAPDSLRPFEAEAVRRRLLVDLALGPDLLPTTP